MAEPVEVHEQKLQIEHFCCKCGYRMIPGDYAMCSVITLYVRSFLHSARIVWCSACWSNYNPDYRPRTAIPEPGFVTPSATCLRCRRETGVPERHEIYCALGTKDTR